MLDLRYAGALVRAQDMCLPSPLNLGESRLAANDKHGRAERSFMSPGFPSAGT